MLIQFFYTLRKYQVKTTLRELLDLLSALEKHVVYADIEAFYSLSRTIMVRTKLSTISSTGRLLNILKVLNLSICLAKIFLRNGCVRKLRKI